MPVDIPFEIQEEIIKRLPVKSLIRFISVSKPWKSLICSRKFIVDYENQPRHNHHRLLVNSKEEYISIDDDDSFPQHKFHVTIPESVNSLAHETTWIIGSSCGLICFFSKTKSIAIIWNPTIKRSVDIVVPNVIKNKTIVGFGVCPRTLDPKLVKITFNHNTPYKLEATNNIINPWQVEVFTLSSNAWRTMINMPRKTSKLKWNQVFIDGIIYWIATEWKRVSHRIRCYYTIMSFDITIEEFNEIILPGNLVHLGILCILKLRESLVLVDGSFSVWKMDHGGVTKTFTKLFNIRVPNAISYKVHGIRNNGQPIIELRPLLQNKGLCAYEPSSGDIKFSGIDGKIDQVSSYMETLLLLDHCKLNNAADEDYDNLAK